MRALARVEFLVPKKLSPLGETLPALCTGVGLLARVDPAVYEKYAFLRKTFPAL